VCGILALSSQEPQTKAIFSVTWTLTKYLPGTNMPLIAKKPGRAGYLCRRRPRLRGNRGYEARDTFYCRSLSHELVPRIFQPFKSNIRRLCVGVMVAAMFLAQRALAAQQSRGSRLRYRIFDVGTLGGPDTTEGVARPRQFVGKVHFAGALSVNIAGRSIATAQPCRSRLHAEEAR